MRSIQLNNGLRIPALGLGTWKATRGEVGVAVSTALETGYRHIDCATIYKNEREIGESLGRFLHERRKTVKRDELWITSKLWSNAHLAKHVRPALERSLKDLGLDYLDLFLIHWPVSFRQDIEHPKRPEHYLLPSEERLFETWYAMEKLVHKGLLRSIGVSNFKLPRLQRLVKQATLPPVTNQMECHPFLQQKELITYCKTQDIILTAYAPLGSSDRPQTIRKPGSIELLSHPLLKQLAKQTNHSPSQLLLAWGLARGCSLIPKSTHPSHIRENFQAVNIEVPSSIIQQIDGLDQNLRLIDGAPFCGSKSPYTLDWLWQ